MALRRAEKWIIQSTRWSTTIFCSPWERHVLHENSTKINISPTHFKVENVRKYVRTTVGDRFARLNDVRQDHRLVSKVLSQQFGTLDSQLAEPPFSDDDDDDYNDESRRIHFKVTLPVIRIFGGPPLGVNWLLKSRPWDKLPPLNARATAAPLWAEHNNLRNI